MKIAILASNRKPIPSPKNLIFAPGVIIHELTEGLVKKGHEVTLFAPIGTKTSARLITAETKSLYEDFASEENFINKRAENYELYSSMDNQYELRMASTAFHYIKHNHFDIIHAHKTLHEIYFTPFVDVPTVFTLHDNLWRETIKPIDKMRLQKYAKSVYYVSISDSQREGGDYLKFVKTVYNGIHPNEYHFGHGGENLLFVGRIDRQKGFDTALEVAQRSKRPITVAGDEVKSLEGEREFKKAKSLAVNNKINFLGHIPFNEMSKVYGQGRALLFPIRWAEAFGLVMIEAMACGTPVIAFRRGSISEIIKDGITGFICPPDDQKAMIKAVKKIYEMPENEYQQMRQACRKHVEEKFTIEKMINGYEEAYQKVIEDWEEK